MSEGFIEVAPDSTGKQVRTNVNTVSGNTVHQQVVTVADSTANLINSTNNSLNVSLHDGNAAANLNVNSAANMATATQSDALKVASPGNWATNQQPAVGALASAVRPAGGGGVRHVCNAISFSWSTDGTANGAAQQITVNLRDGASGAGTVLMTWSPARTTTTATDAGNSGSIHLSGLNILGSANTAMTLEFAGTASNHEQYSANVVGYDVV